MGRVQGAAVQALDSPDVPSRGFRTCQASQASGQTPPPIRGSSCCFRSLYTVSAGNGNTEGRHFVDKGRQVSSQLATKFQFCNHLREQRQKQKTLRKTRQLFPGFPAKITEFAHSRARFSGVHSRARFTPLPPLPPAMHHVVDLVASERAWHGKN